jgi:hypothetical protein
MREAERQTPETIYNMITEIIRDQRSHRIA